MRILRPALVLSLVASLALGGAPALAAQPAGLEVKVGQAADFSRIEFHGQQPRSSKREGKDLVFRFSTRTAPDIARLKVDPPMYLKAATARVDKQGLELRADLRLDDGDAQIGKDQGDTIVNLKPALAAAARAEGGPEGPGPTQPDAAVGQAEGRATARADTIALIFSGARRWAPRCSGRGEAILAGVRQPRGDRPVRRAAQRAAVPEVIQMVPGAKVAAPCFLALEVGGAPP